MSWLYQQPVMWQELIMLFGGIVIGLYFEDWIDQWRQRKR
jgi:hypothetical protein